MNGTLFIVATPIGNLEDLTFRALRVLREVDLIAAEDTRRTSKLLAHYEIRKPLLSVREHNEAREAPKLLDRIREGTNVALVSDAGTPGIADPGTVLVRLAHDRGIPVVPIPGPSAVATAVSVSGFPADQFVFMGFPPATGLARERWFQQLEGEPRTVVFFEAPHRIHRTWEQLNLVNRPIIVLREATKKFEELVVRPIASSGTKAPSSVGEFALVVGPMAETDRVKTESHDPEQIFAVFGRLTDKASFSEDESVSIISKHHNLTEADVRKLLKKARISVKQQKTGLE